MAPALGWTRQLAKPHTRRTFRNAGFTSEVRIAATRDLPAAGVRSGIGHHAGSALGTRRVSRAAARGPAGVRSGAGFDGRIPLSVGGNRSVLPRASRRGDPRRARARNPRERLGVLPPREHPRLSAGAFSGPPFFPGP